MKTNEDQVIELAQKCLSDVPVIVLGSGASRSYGVGGMSELGDCLKTNVMPIDDDEQKTWERFIADIQDKGDLEGALHRVALPPSLELRVVEETRKLLLRDDQSVFSKIANGMLRLALSDLLRHLLRTANPHIIVVTTNYDRLAEYAADQAGVAHHAGFSHGYWRTFSEFPVGKSPQWVEILKVHGSLDWFFDANQNPVALPDALPPPTGFTPVMVTPGIGKYQRTHDDPFRTIITKADAAFAAAHSIFSVGYGFRDNHIQPKMRKRITEGRVATVFLARTLSSEIRTFLKTCGNPNYLALEQSGTNTRAYFPQAPDGVEMTGSMWEFPEFLKMTNGNP